MSTLIDRINALEVDDAGTMISKDAVLKIVADAFVIELEPHGRRRSIPDSEVDRVTWATLDTALRVIATGAVRINLIALREAMGVDNVYTDEEIIAEASEQLGYPATLANAATLNDSIGRALLSAFDQAVVSTADAVADSFGGES